jgi:hypothetical protein
MKVKNKLGNTYSGTIGKSKTACVHKGKQYVRTYVIPNDPKTAKQMRQRRKYARAVEIWKQMSATDKEIYNKRATNLNMSGYNLFISEFTRRKS